MANASGHHDVDAILVKAKGFFDSFQYELAARFLQRAATLAPARADIVDLFADALIEMERFDEAKAALARSIELAPAATPEKWLKYAQLHEGDEALQMYLRGVALLRSEHSSAARRRSEVDAEAMARLPMHIAAACAAMCELYMTDLCDAEDAEAQCERWVGEAFAADPASASALYALANLRLCQQRQADAGAALLKLAERILATEADPTREAPSKQMRLGTAKMLVEVEQYEIAGEVLKQELRADDEDADVISHLAQCALAMGDVGSASLVLQQGVQRLEAACGKGPTAEKLATLQADIADLHLLATELRERSAGAGQVAGQVAASASAGGMMDMEEEDSDL